MTYKKTKKVKRQVYLIIVHVKALFNNNIVIITTMDGGMLLSGSVGNLRFKGSHKSTPFAASQVRVSLAHDMAIMSIKNIEVNLQGSDTGMDFVVRSL